MLHLEHLCKMEASLSLVLNRDNKQNPLTQSKVLTVDVLSPNLGLRLRRGSAIAKIVGANAAKYDRFNTTVNMWVFEEMVDGRKLTEIINTDHENVKYLPGHKLPPNVVSTGPPAFSDAAACIPLDLGLVSLSGGRSRLGRISERS